MENEGQQIKKAIIVYCHGQPRTVDLPWNGTILDIKKQMNVGLRVPVEKLVIRLFAETHELNDTAVLRDGSTALVQVKVNIVVKVGETKHPIETIKDSNGKKIKELVAQKIGNNGVINMKLGLVDEDANNQVVSVGDDTPLYGIKGLGLKDGAEFVLE